MVTKSRRNSCGKTPAFLNFQQEHNGITIGEYHLVTESCVFAISSLVGEEKDFHAKPLLSKPICNHQTQKQQNSIFAATLKNWEETYSENMLLANITTDGDAGRRSVLEGLRIYELNDQSPIYTNLQSLKYMDLHISAMDVTYDFDPKHLCKRIQNNIINGKLVILGTKITVPQVRVMLQSHGYDEHEIFSMLNHIDRQNVPLAVRLLEVLSKDSTKQKISARQLDTLIAFSVLKGICHGIISFFAKPMLNLHKILGNVPTMSHFLFILKHHSDISMPNVLDHDVQATVQNLLFLVARYKVYLPAKPLYIYQVGINSAKPVHSCSKVQGILSYKTIVYSPSRKQQCKTCSFL